MTEFITQSLHICKIISVQKPASYTLNIRIPICPVYVHSALIVIHREYLSYCHCFILVLFLCQIINGPLLTEISTVCLEHESKRKTEFHFKNLCAFLLIMEAVMHLMITVIIYFQVVLCVANDLINMSL